MSVLYQILAGILFVFVIIPILGTIMIKVLPKKFFDLVDTPYFKLSATTLWWITVVKYAFDGRYLLTIIGSITALIATLMIIEDIKKIFGKTGDEEN